MVPSMSSVDLLRGKKHRQEVGIEGSPCEEGETLNRNHFGSHAAGFVQIPGSNLSF